MSPISSALWLQHGPHLSSNRLSLPLWPFVLLPVVVVLLKRCREEPNDAATARGRQPSAYLIRVAHKAVQTAALAALAACIVAYFDISTTLGFRFVAGEFAIGAFDRTAYAMARLNQNTEFFETIYPWAMFDYLLPSSSVDEYWSLPAWLAIVVSLAVTIAIPLLTRRTYPGHCDACGYDLNGLDLAVVCPECGAHRSLSKGTAA